MPVYEYQCPECNHITEQVRFLKEYEEGCTVKCEKCGANAKRILSTFRYGMGRGGQAIKLR